MPKPSHEVYRDLNLKQRTAVSQLAAILRVADGASRGRSGIRTMDVSISKKKVTLTVTKSGDLLMEQHALRSKSNLFQQVFGKQVVLQSAGRRPQHD